MVVEAPSANLTQMLATLDVSDEYFWMPERLVPFEHWVGHIPFAFWLVKVLRPRRLVELGTHRGNSYCAMCQSLSAFGIEGRAHAVDTWQGDVHMEFEVGLLEELKAHHDPRYAAFSELMPMSFDEARGAFADRSIDLLHIDGTHTYEAVRHDFETWLPKMSDRGVILFHDTVVRESGFGVWHLWDELARRYPSFSFYHSFGLGVLGVGTHFPSALQALFARSQEPEAATIRTLFATRGDALVDHLCRQTAEAAAASAAVDIRRREAELNAKWSRQAKALTARLHREIAMTSRLSAELRVAMATRPTIADADHSASPTAPASRTGIEDARTRSALTGLRDMFRRTNG